MNPFSKPQQYPEALIAPMRQDLLRFGVEEARTAADVDKLTSPGNGTVMIVTNSVCGCAAGRARPAIGIALRHSVRPDKSASVFAGADVEAVARSARAASPCTAVVAVRGVVCGRKAGVRAASPRNRIARGCGDCDASHQRVRSLLREAAGLVSDI